MNEGERCIQLCRDVYTCESVHNVAVLVSLMAKLTCNPPTISNDPTAVCGGLDGILGRVRTDAVEISDHRRGSEALAWRE